jgi:hypothetical protein
MTAWWIGVALAQDADTVTSQIEGRTTVATPTPAVGNSADTDFTMPEVAIGGRLDKLIGIADSAGQGTTGAAQLEDRPILRSGEVLETVPGVIITQHVGSGKANQYFLRGFNLDHGTDFAVFLDDIPINLPSHAHGEGCADMNVVIPELVERSTMRRDRTTPTLGTTVQRDRHTWCSTRSSPTSSRSRRVACMPTCAA